jgi:hypothetical protein
VPVNQIVIFSLIRINLLTVTVRSPAKAKDFSYRLGVQTSSEAHSAFYPVGTAGPFPKGEARSRRDADNSPPSSAEFKNVYELYLLSPLAPAWRVVEQLYILLLLFTVTREVCWWDSGPNWKIRLRYWRHWVGTSTWLHGVIAQTSTI